MNFDSVIGVDVSDPMLEVARRDVPGVIFLKQDIIRRPIEQNFDVITAFRFFLNAEDDLRKSALNSLYRCLRTDGVLILNIHMNSSSIMGVLYRGLNFALGREVHKTCGIHEIERLLSESGFKVKEVIWYGLMPRPGHYFPGLMEWLVLRVERLFGRLGLVGRFAQSFVVVACRRD
jgi:SAM-dependent methyltransferase